MNKLKKVICVILTVLTFFSIFSTANIALATEYNEYLETEKYKEKLLTETVDTNDGQKAEIICEVVEKRDEFSKTYLRADGSYTQVLSNSPLHIKNNNKWENIDNSLVNEDNSIKNSSGKFDIEFPETLSESGKITVENGGESIAFTVKDIKSSNGVVDTSSTVNTDIITEDLSKTYSGITYKNIEENTDIQYIVSPVSVKENIIVHDSESLKDSYSFNIEKGDLNVTTDSENNIIFKNSKNQTVFTIPAPVMTDSNNAVSYDIDVSIENTQTETMTLTYTPSKEWLKASDRVYPVTIDPVIALPDMDDSLIQDTVIVNDTEDLTKRTTNYSNSVEGYIADTDTVKGNILVKLDMDFFTCFKQTDIEITDVNYYGDGYIVGGNALVKPITGSWDYKTITYNDVFPGDSVTEPLITYENTVVDYFTGVSADTTEPETINLHFNITKLFKEWLSGERANNGFAIVPENSNTYGVFYLAGEYTPADTAYTFNSYCSVDYVDASGTNDSFEYLSQEIGRAGTVNVNVFSRGLSLSRLDLSMDGLRMPANIGFNYGSSFVKFLNIFNRVLGTQGESEIPLYYGNNWIPSYVQMIGEVTEGQFQYFTGEGTLVTFNKIEETAEDGTTNITFEADETSDSGYSLELTDQTKEISLTNLKLTTPYGETAYFNETGLVVEICEPEANADGTYDKISITYDSNTPFKIDSVCDGIGRKYDFIYNAETDLLCEVKCTTANGTSIKAGTTDVDLKVTYTYDENQNLTGVTYPDGKTVTYTYDSNGNLIKVKNIDNYNIQYTYDSLNKVTGVAEYADTTPGNSIALTQLGNRQVKVTDSFAGTETYQFGRDGKLHYTFDENGNYCKSTYAPANDEDVLEFGDWRVSSENLLKNGSFEEVSSSVSNSGGAKHWSNAFTRVENETTTNGNYAYNISSESAVTEYLEQTVEVKNVQPYTLSAYVKSANPEGTQGKLYLKITALNANGDTTVKMQSIETAEDWTRVSVTFNPVSESGTFAVTKITACIGFENSCGTYYVDDVQLETGKGTAEYNLIENGSFNHTIDNAPTKWSEAEVSQKVIYGKNVNAVKLAGGLPYYTENADGTYTLNDSFSAITQNVKINGKKGDIYSVGAWFNGLFDDNYINPDLYSHYGDIVPQLTNSSAQIKVTYTYNETTDETTGAQQTVTENFAVDFQPHNENWQYVNDSFVLKADVESVDVTVVTKNITTDSYATGIELTLNDSAMSFSEGEETTDTTETTESTETTETTETEVEEVVEECACGCEDCLYGENCPCTGAVNGECQCPECLRKATSTKDNFGNTISNKTTSGASYIETLSSYTSDGNQLSSYTDENGNVYEYSYDFLNSILKSVSNLNDDGQVLSDISYAYDAAGNVISISSNVSESVAQTLQYVYVNDRLRDIITPNEVYRIIYDVWGQVLSVNIVSSDSNSENLVPLVQYTYYTGENRAQVKTVTYNNSPSVQNVYEYSYYDDGTVKNIKLNNDDKHNINYDNLGVLTSIENVGGRTVEYTDSNIYIYNNDGALVYVSETNDDGLTTEENYGVMYKKTETLYDYNSDTGVSTQTNGLNISEKYNLEQTTKTDWFGRENKSELTVFDISDETPITRGSVVTEYIYPEKEDGKTSSTIEKFINKTYNGTDTEVRIFDGYSYEYTSQGKISTEKTLNADGTTTDKYSYKYDKIGQLIRFNDAVANKTYTYSYDSNGNILSKSEYLYTLSETLGTATNTITYGYDTQWKDMLTTVGDKTITYDSIGNPTGYLGATLTWEGRTLTSYEDETNIIEYEYDENGMRYRTSVTNKEDGLVGSYEYVWIDGKLISIIFVSNGSTEMAKYLYNDNDEPMGMVVTTAEGNLTTYYYLKNAQGDITHIVSASGKNLVEFTYDVFGNQTVHYQADGSTVTGMIELVEQVMACALNPFGYRGYCYDIHSKLYYLQSRYYDPQTGRFINADDTNYLNATGTVLGCNLFAYCENDPVNRVDPKGTRFIYIDLHYTKLDTDFYFISAKLSQINKYGRVTRISPFFIFEDHVISISNRTAAMRSIINKKWTYYLAYGIYYAAKRLAKYSLLGRTIEGIQFELLVHYILYIGLKDVKNRNSEEEKAFLKAKTTDIGTPNKEFGYDSNAAAFEKMRYLYSSFETKLFSNKYTGYALAKVIIKLGLMN